MKVIITGASGNLGSDLINSLQGQFEFVRLGRQAEVMPWQLGVKPDPEPFFDAEAILHLAWSLHDREKDFHLNVGGTALLAKFAKELGIPFIFISSIAAEGKSHYGKSKLEAERYVTDLGGICIRSGLIPTSNTYMKDGKRFGINLVPKLSGKIGVTELETLCIAIKNLLNEIHDGGTYKAGKVTIITRFVQVQELFRNGARFKLLLPNSFILLVLKLISKVSRQGRNLQDSYLSMISTLESDSL